MTLLNQPRQTTLAEVLQAFEDVELTSRFSDYRIDPVNPLVPLRAARVLREGYEYRFQEPYLDPDAFPNNPIPDFMVTAIYRVGAALLDYMIRVSQDRQMPQLTCYDLLTERYEALKAAGYQVYKFDYSEEFGCELLAVRLKCGLLWLPLESIVAWVNELNTSIAAASDMAAAL